MALFFEPSPLKNNLTIVAEKALSIAVDDIVLMQLYALFKIENALHEERFVLKEPIPLCLRIDDASFNHKGGIEYQECRELFLSIPDVFYLIKFVFPDVFKDYSLAENSLRNMMFTSSKLPEFALVLPILFLKNKKKDKPESTDTLFQIFKNELKNTPYEDTVNYRDFLSFHEAMNGYYLDPNNTQIISKKKTDNDKLAAIDAVHFMKDELSVTEIVDQLWIVAGYMSGIISAPDILKFINDKRDGRTTSSFQFQSDNTEKSLTRKCQTLMKLLKEANKPRLVLESIYSIKKTPKGNVPSIPRLRRNTSADIECSLIYNFFTSSLIEKDRTALIVFPSPFFIRMYDSDIFFQGQKTIFIVPSNAEKSLWDLEFKDLKKDYSFYTIDSFIKNSDSKNLNIKRILVFALSVESTYFAGTNIANSSLAQFICMNYQKAKLIVLASNESYLDKTSFTWSYIHQNKQIDKILFLPNSIESDGPKKKNIWFGTIEQTSNARLFHG